MEISDPFNLERFVSAQEAGGAYASALAELRAARKSGHWMWFIFPQLAGLGRSETARRYAIRSLEEAAAYLRHDRLGPRLIECTTAVEAIRERTAVEIFGPIDALKLRSSMTLFLRSAPWEPLFGAVLERFFAGAPDAATDRLLEAGGAP
jgi:uncharacterized protein (DUF1810 family)